MADIEKKLNITSYSRYELYQSCSQKYKNRYIDKVPYTQTLKLPLIKGTLFHACLEDFNDPHRQYDKHKASKVEIFACCLEIWMEKIGLEFENSQIHEIAKFAQRFGELITKGSIRAKGPDRILNSDGTVPKNLENFPPKTFKNQLVETGLSSGVHYWNNWAASREEFFYANSFAFLLGDVYSFFEAFQWADWIETSGFVELPVSTNDTNLVEFGELGLFLRAYIDWIAITKTGKTAFIDYKTGKTKPTPNEVLHHPQLNVYARVSQVLFNKLPDFISIYHAQSGEYIVAIPHEKIVESICNSLEITQQNISNGNFTKSHPGMFGSPCKTYNFKTKSSDYCEYLGTCWPMYLETEEK